MDKLEKKIEEAANIYCTDKGEPSEVFEAKQGFIAGALSPEAEEYHQQGLYNDEEVKELLLRITHTVADYIEAALSGEATQFNVNDWFEQNKKKS